MVPCSSFFSTQKAVCSIRLAFISLSRLEMMRTRSSRHRFSASVEHASYVEFIAATSVLNIMSVAKRV